MSFKKIAFYGPIMDISGYAHAARGYIKALLSQGIEVESYALKIDKFEPDIDDEIKKTIKITTSNIKEIGAAIEKSDADILFNHTTPELSLRDSEKFNIIANSWETDRIPKDWAMAVSDKNLCLVSCKDNVDAYKRSGVSCPIEYLPLACDPTRYTKDYSKSPIDILSQDNIFKFLTICQISPKKGLDTLLSSYFCEFTGNDDVMLVMKLYFNTVSSEEREMIKNMIDLAKKDIKLNHYPKILIINDNYTEDQMASLYKSCDSYVLLSKGEGFSLTHFDAMGFGLSPIGVNYGGTKDIIEDFGQGYLVDGEMNPVIGAKHPYRNLYTSYENWMQPSLIQSMKCMRDAYTSTKNNKEILKSRGVEFVKKYSYDKIGLELVNLINKHMGAKENA